MWQQARAAIDQGLQLDPGNLSGLRQLAGVHRRLGEGERALECLERASALDPLSPRLKRELASLAAAAASAPQPAEVPIPAPAPAPSVSRFGAPGDAELTALLRQIDRPPAAGRELDAEGIDDRDPVPTVTLARLYARQGFPDRALEIYRRVLSADPGNQDARRDAEALTAA